MLKKITGIYFLLFLFLLLPLTLLSQELYLRSSNPEAENLLDELATMKVIRLNSAEKPYSRSYIAGKLSEALDDSSLTVSQRQKAGFLLKSYSQELETYHQGFGLSPFEASFKSEPLRIKAVPIIKGGFSSNGSGMIETGAGTYGYLGKHLGFSASVSRGFQTEELSSPAMFTLLPGQKYTTYSNGATGYWDWTAQFVYSWKWGSFGLIKDRFEWGNNEHGASIISMKPPSFPRIQLRVNPARWITFTYFHGMLDSEVTDSNHYYSSGETRDIPKFMAANLLTVTPWRGLDISLGNSAIYADKVQLVYFIPVLFYKSVDHTLYPEPGATGGTNSQMFFDISSRQIRHLHLWLTLFVDEFKMSRIREKDENNFLGWKGGFTLWDLPFENVSFTAEGTRTLPLVYQHNVEVTTYESSLYNLGNYIRDNSQEIFFRLTWSPLARLNLSLAYLYAEHGDDYQYIELTDPVRLPVLENITWKKQEVMLKGRYSLSANAMFYLEGGYSQTSGYAKFTPDSMRGNMWVINGGAAVGF